MWKSYIIRHKFYIYNETAVYFLPCTWEIAHNTNTTAPSSKTYPLYIRWNNSVTVLKYIIFSSLFCKFGRIGFASAILKLFILSSLNIKTTELLIKSNKIFKLLSVEQSSLPKVPTLKVVNNQRPCVHYCGFNISSMWCTPNLTIIFPV